MSTTITVQSAANDTFDVFRRIEHDDSTVTVDKFKALTIEQCDNQLARLSNEQALWQDIKSAIENASE